jgi:hypothetical protein
METMILDFSILDGFTFGTGAGRYSEKRACIMSGLYLVTQIAEGKITLDQAIAKDEEGEAEFEVNDRVTCVSPLVRDLVVHRNDLHSVSDEERKLWAMKTMPRIVGTAYVGDPDSDEAQAYETTLKRIAKQASLAGAFLEAKALAQKFIEDGDSDHLRQALYVLSSKRTTPKKAVMILDAQIEAVLAHLGKAA